MLDLEIVNFLRWMIQMGVTQYCTYVKYGSFAEDREILATARVSAKCSKFEVRYKTRDKTVTLTIFRVPDVSLAAGSHAGSSPWGWASLHPR